MAVGRELRPGGSSARIWPRLIRDALERDRFALHAQRIVDVRSGAIVRHELFLRMVDQGRQIPAGEFVVAAEKHGSIRGIDRWVVERGVEIAAAGHAVHVNLSMRSTDADLLEAIRYRLSTSRAEPGDLVFELGEAQLADADDRGAAFVQRVTQLGCRLAVDNYIRGSGPADLLRRFPISYVKVDPRVIGELVTSSERRRTLASTVLKAHRFGQWVIAPGVESLATLDVLEDLGVDEAQGHVFGAPEPVEQLLEHLV